MSATSTDQRGNGLPGLPLATLRGVAQVDFQSSYWTALLFVLALLLAGWQFAVFALLGTFVSTLTAWFLGANRDRITLGLEGFNGTLIGVAVVLFFDVRWITVLLTIMTSVMGAVVTSALNSMLSPYNVATLTAPFCAVTTALVVAAPSFERVWRGHIMGPPPSAGHPGTALTFTDVWQGLLNGIAQVFFQGKWYVGLTFLIGLLVASRVAGIAAFVSSAIGMIVAWILGAPAADIGAGLYGYNAVLAGLALTGVFVAVTPWGVLYAVLAAIGATVLTAALNNFFEPFQGSTLTWPFVLVTWFFLAAVPVLSRIHRTS
ncbi:urea transporter [Spongiactinospora sp. TRM90649]|uniref:urea transporter n=1 Tax=Spongiactinospora sp. TRM90649 TaxID=3031114 RepID=UPI0023F6A38C|nr:urea transporter [Spongiactinospora sp. TRM90649]MDF5756115.1 urea transporter [Spongiactinospora sp. TRM90649]